MPAIARPESPLAQARRVDTRRGIHYFLIGYDAARSSDFFDARAALYPAAPGIIGVGWKEVVTEIRLIVGISIEGHFMQLLRRRALVAAALIALCLSIGLLLSACGDGDGDSIRRQESGRLIASPLSVTFEQIEPGNSASRAVVLKNNHESQPLTLYRVKMSARDGATAQDLELLDKPADETRLEPGAEVEFQIRYEAAGRANAATIEVRSSDPTYSDESPLHISVDTQASRPAIDFSPTRVSFARLPAGQSQEQTLIIRNFGRAPLSIYRVVYAGGSDFSIDEIDGEEVVLDPYDSVGVEQNPERYELAVKVRYRSSEEGSSRGRILVESNDLRGQPREDGRASHEVDVRADAQAACLMVDDLVRNFGPVPLGAERPEAVMMSNCGSETLVVSGIELLENTDDREFSLALGSWATNSEGALDEEIHIEPGESEVFRVNYGPTKVGNGTGKLRISSNDPASSTLDLDLVGRGTNSQCPEAKVLAAVRGEDASARPTISAAPLDYIVLDGSSSSDPNPGGEVVDYEWTVLEVPDGTAAQLGPVSGDPNDNDQSKREFRALITGTYKFGLDVTNDEGVRSCEQAVVTVVAIPREQIHIELTWTNPEDPDETDDYGSDLDLHFVKMGPGTWFDAPYDIYFRNTNRGGGGIWNPESPSLDIDVTDGMGPENIQLDDPVNCQWYAVGVHYYREAFGTAFATVRVYINEQLVFEQLHQEMQRGDQFWDVARIHWNQGASPGFHIYPVDDLMPAAPSGTAPRVTEEMTSSGLCTLNDLY